ncbi:hypothetical protein B0J12DRAFT_572169 [Macrophomina phaseolina]|uniref:SPRY domain-containing protein n=1 Tax=Macrophomina phaseolina TaxID=35725 RepID=A0ABQ8GDB3_9PEZI|nr:hypothetical protein B0J12DRAFT_572169 [Macrophomina phaseolina]
MPSWNPFKKEKQQQQPEDEQYAPPPGPPPAIRNSTTNPQDMATAPPPPPHPYIDYSNRPPPPPQSEAPSSDPPPYHDWTIVPDTALLPPPPPLNNDSSPTANASAESGEAAFRWCNANPLYAPHPSGLPETQLSALVRGHIPLALPPPPSYRGEALPHSTRPGAYRCRTASGCGDACLWTALPLYAARAHNPLLTRRPKTIYFEIRVNGVGGMPGSRPASLDEADAGIAVGFVAQPYPAWRLPGWQRGSLGVHGDDGRRYVNDTFGGVDFTTAFAQGDTVGLGMTFRAPTRDPPPGYGQPQQQQQMQLDVEVFFTRNGKRAGGWDLHEELDERAIGGVVGLEGDFDLCGAVGVFGGVDLEVFFNQADWMYRPEHV